MQAVPVPTSRTHRSSEAFISKTASLYAGPSSACARHKMEVVLPVPGEPCATTTRTRTVKVRRKRVCCRTLKQFGAEALVSFSLSLSFPSAYSDLPRPRSLTTSP
jgi:hypothetical protein